jgi:hypothetical protein
MQSPVAVQIMAEANPDAGSARALAFPSAASRQERVLA